MIKEFKKKVSMKIFNDENGYQDHLKSINEKREKSFKMLKKKRDKKKKPKY